MAKVDLREWASPVEEQQQLGSCTAQAVVGAYELLLNRYYPEAAVDLSRLFLYYNARKISGYIDEDIGAYVSTAVEAVQTYGLCTEALWPYSVDRFDVEPNWRCYHDATRRTVSDVYEVTARPDLIDRLDQGLPVVVGVAVYNTFNQISDRSTVLALPRSSEEPIGSHAMCVVGYDDARQLFLVRNSFGADWGDGGHVWIPYAYADQNFSDMWTFDIQLTR